MQQAAQTDSDRTNRLKLVWGLISLIGPTALIIIALLGYAVANFAFASFEQPSQAKTILNIVMFLVGAVSVLTWLPGIIVGIILLATRKQASYANHQS